jgi:site-specific DNA-methyltransferase (adenine-specific)
LPYWKVTRQWSKITDNIGGWERKTEYFQEFTNYPKNILDFSKDKEKIHPTQKPVALIEYLIKTYTHEWETVLDFTAGSFTTAIACENTNRKRICIEKDEWYYNIWIERVNRDTK